MKAAVVATDPVHPETGDDSPFRYGLWSWSEPRYTEHFRRCSFCGSIHPGDLADEPSWQARWADRKYGWPHKFYVDIPNRNPELLYAFGGTSRFKEEDRARGYVPFEELTEEQLAIIERDRWHTGPGQGTLFGTRPHHYGKFYTIHLADPNINDEVKEKLAFKSGLRFTFRDGKVGWDPYKY